MPGNTRFLNLPTPLGDDPLYVSDDTIRAAITGIEASIVLGANSRDANALSEQYPKCVSLMMLTAEGSVDGEWGFGSGAVLTCRRSGDYGAWQIYFGGSIEAPTARLRMGTAAGWGKWERIVAPGLAKAEATGALYATTTDTEPHTNVPVLFPGDRFSVPPNVLVSIRDTTATDEFWVQAEDITADGFTAHFYRSTPGAIRAFWYAVGGVG